ncbi:MAG: primase-helicase zinc-binding domain-containing protein [Planctomycetota bacterium]
MPFLDVHELRTASEGRWGEILARAGLPSSALDGRGHPCPKCGGRDRFSVFHGFEARGAVHCRKCFTAGSPILPGDGIQTLRWWLGCSFADALVFLADSLGGHPAGSVSTASVLPQSPALSQNPDRDRMSQSDVDGHTAFARDAFERHNHETRQRLAIRLGLTVASLLSLRVGLNGAATASTWPMRDASARVVGVRLVALPWRRCERRKWSRRESRSGMFLSRETAVDQSRLWITEGASDTAAALGLGLWAVGRASCGTSTDEVRRYVEKQGVRKATVIADNDSPGLSGAKRLARVIAASGATISIITPPTGYGDLREWTRAGAGAAELRACAPIEVVHRPAQLTFDFTSQPMLTT